jgi:hypothetical protein
MREQVVEAAKNIAIEMDDYMNESAEGQAALRDDGEVY